MSHGDGQPEVSAGSRSLPPIALRILQKRFPESPDPVREWLPGPPRWSSGLPDLDVLEEELLELMDRGGKVVLYGHDDMDGITGLYIGMTVLGGEGFEVIPIIPNRATESYGISPDRLRGILEPEDLLLTVDYGCSAVEGVRWARDLGARVVITDHHTLNPPLPESHGMVNPQVEGDYETSLSGCGVLYAALVSIFRRWEDDPALLTALALGTVSDRVPLLGWNRYLLERFRLADIEGLEGGIRLLAEKWPDRRGAWTGSLVRQQITSTVGKGEGSGIEVLLEFMMSDSYGWCRKVWRDLGRESRQRAHELSRLFAQAMRRRDDQAMAYGMTLVYLDSIPDGMGGTLASKLCKVTRRGTLVVSPRDNGTIVGEARSMGDWDMAGFLVSMLDRFETAGGHRNAAGFSCTGMEWEELREMLLSRMAAFPVDPVPEPHVDLHVDELPPTEDLLVLAPFGSGFLPPAVEKDGLRYLLQVGVTTASWCITEDRGD